MRRGYSDVLTTLLTRRLVVPAVAVAMLTLGGTLFFYVGRDFFPAIDGGQIQLHVRAPAGTRIEKTEELFQAIEDKIREVIPDSEREQILDNIGLPARNYNLAFADGTTIGVNDGAILVTLKEGHPPTLGLRAQIARCPAGGVPRSHLLFPGGRHGDPDPQFRHPRPDRRAHRRLRPRDNLAVARELRQKLAAIPGIADAHVQQEVDAPEFYAVIDRARAAQFGLTANSIATNLNVSLSSSVQVSPNFWTDPATGTPYFLAVQTPEHRISSLDDLQNTPVGTFTAPNGNPVPQMLENVATLTRDSIPTNANHANIQPVYEVYANVENTDLGTVVRRDRQGGRRGAARSSSPATGSRCSARSRA